MTFSVGQPEQTGLDVILQGLGGGLGQGLQEGLQQFHEQKQTEKQAESLSAYMPKETALSILQAPKELQKPLLYQALYESQVQSQTPQGPIDETTTEIDRNNQLEQPAQKQGISGRSDEQLKQLLSNPVFAKSAEAELGERRDVKKAVLKSDIKRSDKYLDSINSSRESTARGQSSLASIENALDRRDLGFFSPDNLKSMAGFDRWISPEGAILNTAAKEFFIADLERVTGRPNMFLEKILSGAIPQIGKSNQANQVIVEFYKNALDLNEEKIKISDSLEDYYRQTLGYVPGNIGRLVDAQLKPYAKQKEKELVKIFQKGQEKFGTKTAEKELHENLPAASQSRGKIFKDTSTGVIYKSNGKNWKKVS